MADEFVASNEVRIFRNSEELLYMSEIGCHSDYLYPEHEEALREFFQHERDEELGRWRWPENPDYVVYPKANSTTGKRMVRVISETYGYGRDHCEGDHEQSDYRQAAAAYFAAHPESKPWHDAEDGSVWRLVQGEGSYSRHAGLLAIAEGGRFKFQNHADGSRGLDAINCNARLWKWEKVYPVD